MCGKRGHYTQRCYRKLGTYVRNQDGYCYFLAFKDQIKSSVKVLLLKRNWEREFWFHLTSLRKLNGVISVVNRSKFLENIFHDLKS